MNNKQEIYWIKRYENTFNNIGMYIDLNANSQTLRHIPNKQMKDNPYKNIVK